MTKIELELFDDVINALNKIRAINDTGIELHIPEGSPILENIVSLKLLKKETERNQKIIHFVTHDKAGLELLTQLQDEQTDTLVEEEKTPESLNDNSQLSRNVSAKILFPKINIPKIRIPRMSVKLPLLIVGLLVIIGLITAGLWYISQLPKADIKLVVNSEPLARSIQIKIKDQASTSSEQKLLKGYIFKSNISDVLEINSTGEKVIGKKASGKAKIFNKTSEEKEFPKNQTVYFDKDGTTYSYTLNESLTVPARTETPGADPVNDPPIITPGEAEVEATASNIGSEYNVKAGETLNVKNQKKTDFSAVISADFTGGKSEKVKFFSQTDKDKMLTDLMGTLKNKATEDLRFKLGLTQKLIEGTVQTKTIEETYSHKVGDETAKATLTLNVEASGLVYSSLDMDNLLNDLVKDFIPQGFALSSKEKNITVDILGNSSNSVLNEYEADVQVTLKTYVVADVTEENLVESLKGKSIEEATEHLNTIRNIKTYSVTIDPVIPLLNKIPNDPLRVNVEIVRE